MLNYECGGTIKCYKNYYKAKITFDWCDSLPFNSVADNQFEPYRKVILSMLDEMCLADDNRYDWEDHIELGEWASKIMNECPATKLTLEDTRTGRFVKVVRD